MQTNKTPDQVIALHQRLAKELPSAIQLIRVLIKYRNELLGHNCYLDPNSDEYKRIMTLEEEYKRILSESFLMNLQDKEFAENDNGQEQLNSSKNDSGIAEVDKKTMTAQEIEDQQAAERLKQAKLSLRHKNHQCSWPGCGFRTDRNSILEDHMNLHTDQTPHKCTFLGCDRAFSSRRTLEVHFKTTHDQNTRKFECLFEGCGKAFKSKQYLQRHSVKQHTDLFVCTHPDCSFRGANSDELKYHFLIHTGGHRKEFRCTWPGCDRSYVKNFDLKEHLLTHTERRSFKCDWPGCDKEFGTKNGLRLHHKSVHEGRRDKRCPWPGCDYRAYQTSQLKHHMKYVHEPYSSRDHTCTWPGCTSKFVTNAQLKFHLRTHRGEKPVRCEWPGCEMRFAEKSNMKKHLKRHRL